MSNPPVARRDDPGPIVAERRTHRTPAAARSTISHDFAALAFYLGGHARVEQRTLWTLARGDALIVPAGEPHRVINGRDADIWGLRFCVPCLAPDLAPPLLEPFDRVRAGAAPVVRIPAARHRFLTSLFRELQDTSPGRADAPVRLSLLTLILHEVARAAAETAPRGAEHHVVADSLRFIERHCLGPLTLGDIAAAMKRTPSYLTSALTRATGRSAGAWVIAGRMAEARRRLLHSDDRIDVIAEHVGYADATHFIRLFRRTHGATPAAWRAMQRQPPQSGERAGGRHVHGERVIQTRGRQRPRRRRQ